MKQISPQGTAAQGGSARQQSTEGQWRDTPARALVERFLGALDSQESKSGAPSPDASARGARLDGQAQPQAYAGDQTGTREASDGLTDRRRTPEAGLSEELSQQSVAVQAQSALAQAQIQASSANAGAASTYNAAALADLLEKHVRQLLVSERQSHGTNDMRVVLSLTDAALPGTRLSLSRTDSGWLLEAHSSSPESYRILGERTPDLEARFSAGRLGALDVRSTLQE